MGDAADDLTDSMTDARARHLYGDCDVGCPWCVDEEEERADDFDLGGEG